MTRRSPSTAAAPTATPRVTRGDINAVVAQIVERFEPEQIILFGSYAYGEPKAESDVDLLVVMETPLREAEQAVRMCQEIEYHFPLDLIVRTPATLSRRLALGDPFVRELLERGTLLYERTDG